jgi:hypothetical protein
MSLLRRLTIPLVLAFFGLPSIQIGWATLKRGHFTYTSQAGEVQTFSPTENAGIFWGFSVGLCVAGVILLIVAIYLLLRLRPPYTGDLPRRSMPMGLRLLTFACFGFALFLPLSLLPFGHRLHGQEVSFTEFWRRGGGPAFFIAGVLFPLTGYGFLSARGWSRYLFVGISIGLAILSTFSSLADGLMALVWAAAVTYYLFWWPTVRNYFGASETNNAR